MISKGQGLAARKYAVGSLRASDFATTISRDLNTESQGHNRFRALSTLGEPGKPVP